MSLLQLKNNRIFFTDMELQILVQELNKSLRLQIPPPVFSLWYEYQDLADKDCDYIVRNHICIGIPEVWGGSNDKDKYTSDCRQLFLLHYEQMQLLISGIIPYAP